VSNTWLPGIREPAFLGDAPKQTVSLTVNSDLFARIKSLGINASRVAEEALAKELERHRRAAVSAEVSADLSAANNYIAKHGSYADLAREHYRGKKSASG
jgi:post-segregation antitoxin (ccd killing protein)